MTLLFGIARFFSFVTFVGAHVSVLELTVLSSFLLYGYGFGVTDNDVIADAHVLVVLLLLIELSDIISDTRKISDNTS